MPNIKDMPNTPQYEPEPGPQSVKMRKRIEALSKQAEAGKLDIVEVVERTMDSKVEGKKARRRRASQMSRKFEQSTEVKTLLGLNDPVFKTKFAEYLMMLEGTHPKFENDKDLFLAGMKLLSRQEIETRTHQTIEDKRVETLSDEELKEIIAEAKKELESGNVQVIEAAEA